MKLLDETFNAMLRAIDDENYTAAAGHADDLNSIIDRAGCGPAPTAEQWHLLLDALSRGCRVLP